MVLPVWADRGTEQLRTERRLPRPGLRWGERGNHLEIAPVTCLGE